MTDLISKPAYTVIPQAAIAGILRADILAGMTFGLAAALFVVAGALCAPSYRFVVACALYLAGAYVAWWWLRSWYFPEGHSLAYQQSMVPAWFTLFGGFLGVVVMG